MNWVNLKIFHQGPRKTELQEGGSVQYLLDVCCLCWPLPYIWLWSLDVNCNILSWANFSIFFFIENGRNFGLITLCSRIAWFWTLSAHFLFHRAPGISAEKSFPYPSTVFSFSASSKAIKSLCPKATVSHCSGNMSTECSESLWLPHSGTCSKPIAPVSKCISVFNGFVTSLWQSTVLSFSRYRWQ